MSTTRRDFLAATTAAAVSLSAWSKLGLGQTTSPADAPLSDIPELKTPDSVREGDMLFRTLGNTKEKVSLLAVGGYHFGTIRDQAAANKFLHRAIDSGINFLDNCWDYLGGQAETSMGKALAEGGYRKKAFLMTKIDGQTKAAAESQINESLKRLQTDTLDLLQLHEIVRDADPEKHFAKNGSIEALLAAQKAGKCRYFGFTGHKDPSMMMKMLDTATQHNFTFHAVQMPLNPLDAHFRSFARIVLPRLIKEGIAPLAMKTLAGGAALRAARVTAAECIRYAMTLPSATVISGMTSEEQLTDNLALVKTFTPYPKDELAQLLTRTREVALTGDVERFKTSNGFDGTARNPQWLGT